MKAQISPKDWVLLSAYLDGELSARETARAEKKLRASQELRKTLEEMKRTRTLIQSLPRKRVPHSFALTPAMAEGKPNPFQRLFPVLSFVSVASIVAFIAIFLLQLTPNLSRDMTPMTLAMEAQAEKEMLSSDTDTSPMIINWGGIPYQQAAPGMGGGQDQGPEMANAPPPAQEIIVPEVVLEVEAETVAEPEMEMDIQPTPVAAAVEDEAREEGIGEEADMLAAPAEEEEGEVQREIPPAASPTPQVVEEKSAEGSSPILGVRPSEEVGQMLISASPTPVQEQVSQIRANNYTLPIVLILLAVITGLGAIYIRLKY
jgi:hypothetical protein